MEKLLERTRDLRTRDQRGASAVEYGLLVAAIAAVIIAIVFVLGHYVRGTFATTCNNIKAADSTFTESCS